MSLISTYDVRVWMGIKEGDETPNAKIDLLIDAIQDFCDGYTNRKLEAKRYLTDPNFSYLDGMGKPFIYLPQYPVSYVSSAHIDTDREFGSGTLLASDDMYWYPGTGKLMSEAGYFSSGRRNVLVDYTAGYAPIVGGTHNAAVSTYPIPQDLRQVMIEMAVMSFKEGMTAVHTVITQEQIRTQNMLSGGSFWRKILDKYKAIAAGLAGREE